MIVTLAGHVDHGKTALVRLLTGTDTDRLAEEKRRGLTIDLGFAYLRSDDVVVGFVDVPGHHRFIHNMVAGVAAHQHGLLVVAADDGPMPQSREHLQILDLLGVGSGTVVLSKCDRAASMDDVRRRLEALVAGTFLEGAPVIETSAATGQGLDVLRHHLLAEASRATPVQADRPLRMPVDRAFTLQGAGPVVTGTIHDGTVAVEDALFVCPGGATARVRDLRVQDGPAAGARAGDRTAVNLARLDTPLPRRGQWLCAEPDAGHRRVVLELRVLDDFPRPLRHWSPVHVYQATSHATGRLAMLESNRLSPGQVALVELVLDAPLPAKRGDRLLLRDQALEATLGGGSVIDNRPLAGRRRTPARLAAIRACAEPTAPASFKALLSLGPVDGEPFRRLWKLTAGELAELADRERALAAGGWLVDGAHWQGWREALLSECRRRHDGDPTLQGLRENDFEAPVPEGFRGRILRELVTAGTLQQRAGRFQPARHRAELTGADRAMLERVRPLIDQDQPPSMGDLARTLHLPLPRLRAALESLAAHGQVVVISDKRVFLPRTLAELAGTAANLSRRAPFSAREFRDATGIGRNVAIDVLEYFDARGFTRRSGDTRTVTGDASRLPEGARATPSVGDAQPG